MRFVASIDLSTFIWSEEDYNLHKNLYYGMLEVIATVYEQIKFLKIPILIGNNLNDLILSEFPYILAGKINRDFENLTLSFLSNTEKFEYSNNNNHKIISIPILTKQHMNNDIQTEIQSQIYHLFHNGKCPEHKFIVYSPFFKHSGNLFLKKEKEEEEEEIEVEIDTLQYNSENDILLFFDKYKLKFEHNPKHGKTVKYNNGETISPLTCFHQANGQDTAQKLLDNAYLFNGDYYNFDVETGFFVKFVLTIGLTYHGFDLSDEGNNIPHKVRQKFNKDGRKF